MENFQSLGLPESLLQSLTNMDFLKPTPIQAQTIPLALQGSDILGSAQTGTGKTGAYGIPLASHLINNPQKGALILTPTRELAVQVLQAIKLMLGKKSNVRAALLIGGDSMFKQLTQLREGPRLIVGTPGRVNDHLARRSLNLSQTDFIVLDETDRMLDMGFSIQIQEIIKYLPQQRQTLMFSATMAPAIIKTANSYLNNPQRISIGSTTTPILKIKQEILRTTESEKYSLLLDQLDKEAGAFIIFVKTKMGTEKLATKLRGSGHDADAIHGDLKQRSRDQVIRAFRNGNNRILVATDVAARGLDIPHIECVVNYDLPQCPEDYIHRIGRTGRAGAEGKAISLVTNQDSTKWRLIHRLMNPDAKPEPDFQRSKSSDSFKKRDYSRDARPRSDFKPRSGLGFQRDDRPVRSDRPDFKPRSSGSSFQRDDRPARSDRSDFKPRSGLGFQRDDRPARSDRPDFKPRSGPGFQRDDRPVRSDRPDFKPRSGPGFQRDENSSGYPRPDFKPRARPDFQKNEGSFERKKPADKFSEGNSFSSQGVFKGKKVRKSS